MFRIDVGGLSTTVERSDTGRKVVIGEAVKPCDECSSDTKSNNATVVTDCTDIIENVPRKE